MDHDDRHDDDDAVGNPGPAVEQFQRAALDAVKAARAMLDAAESVLEDPAALESVVHAVTSMARTAGETVVGFMAGAAGAPTPAGPADPDPDDRPTGGFERIRID